MSNEIEKSKLIDVESSEKKINKKLSFLDKFFILLGKINSGIETYKSNESKRSEKEIERLKLVEKKTALRAKIAKNKASELKHLKKKGGGNDDLNSLFKL